MRWVGCEWLVDRLAMGHGSYVNSLVIRIRRDKSERKTLENVCKNMENLGA